MHSSFNYRLRLIAIDAVMISVCIVGGFEIVIVLEKLCHELVMNF